MLTHEILRPENLQGAEIFIGWLVVIGSLTQLQRQAVIELYGYQCVAKELGMPGTHHGRIEVNHDPPESWSREQGLDPEGPQTAFTPLCEAHHDHYHKGEIKKAKQEYKKGNKNSFKEMVESHKENAKKHIIFWQDKYSPKMQELFRQKKKEANWELPPKNGKT